MNNQPDERSTQPLEFVDDRRDLIPNKCIWKCAAACFHDAPNEQHGRESMASIITRRFSRRQLLKGAAAATVPLVLAATPVGSSLFPAVGPKRADAAIAGRSPRLLRHSAPHR